MTSLLRTGSLGEPSSLAQTVSVGSAARRFGAFDARLVRIIGVELAAFEVFPPSGSDGSLPSGGFSEGGRKEVNGGQSGGVREVRVVCEVWNWYAKHAHVLDSNHLIGQSNNFSRPGPASP